MRRLPKRLMPHRALVSYRPKTGEGAYGPVYGPVVVAKRAAIDDKRRDMVALLRATHPDVRAILDAPLQMTRANEALLTKSGRPGTSDLETLLGVAASAWPEGAPRLQGLHFEGQRLSWPVADWQPPQIEAFTRQLAGAGWSVQSADGTLTLARADEGGR